MPEMIPSFSLDEMVLDSFEEGKIIKSMRLDEGDEESVHYRIYGMRKAMKEIYQLYSQKKAPTKKQFAKIMDKHSEATQDEIHHFLASLENDDELFKVEQKKVDKQGNITIKLKKLDGQMKNKLVMSVAKKLADKMTKEQIETMLQERVRTMNDADVLEKIDKKLDKDDVQLEGKRGCFFLTIGEEKLFLI